LRSRPRAVRMADLGSLAAATAAADLHQGVGQSLSGTPIVALRGPGIGLDRGPDDGAGVWRDLALDPDQSVDRLANLQVAPSARPARSPTAPPGSAASPGSPTRFARRAFLWHGTWCQHEAGLRQLSVVTGRHEKLAAKSARHGGAAPSR